MKKNLYIVGMLALAASTFIACEKEAQEIADNDVIKHVATVVLGKDDITKTAVVEGQESASYVWTAGDEAYLHVYENGKEGTITDFALSNGNSIATLTVEFTGAEAASYDYTAKYAKTISGNGNPLVQSTQAPTASSFDPAADILVSKASDDVTGVTVRATELTFTMGRVVSVNKMTLTGLDEGELVSKVEFTLGTSFLGGNYTGSSYNSGVKTLTANYETPLAVGADGKFPVYFTCAPVEAASITSVVVTTDQNVYTKSSSLDPNPFDGKTITFAVGTMKRFNMAMGGYGTPISSGTPYTLVENQSDLCPGATYIIVGNNTDLVAMAGQSTNNRLKVDVTATNKVITVDNSTGAFTFTINSLTNGTKSGYSIQDNSNSNYLYTAATTSNKLLSRAAVGNDNNAMWAITISNGVASIVNVGNTSRGVMCYNTGSTCFACYSALGTYKTLSLYVDETTCIPTLAKPSILAEVQNTNQIYVTWGDVTNADSYYVTCTGQEPQSINPGVEEASFTALADGTYTVTVRAISNDHSAYLDSETALVEGLLVGDPKGTVSNPYTASDILTNYPTGSGDDSFYVSGTITNIQEVSTEHGNATYTISDGVNNILVYRGKYLSDASFTSGSQIAENDQVIVYGKIGVYNSTPQLAQGNYLYSLNGKTKVLTAGTVTATPDNANKQITVEWTAATGSDQAISYHVTCGTQYYDANAAGSHTFTMADYGSYDVAVVASASDAISATSSTTATLTDPNAGTQDHAATIKFGSASGSTNVNTSPKTGEDSQGNTWTITTEGTTSFTPNASYAQIGSGNKPASSITFTTTLANSATIKSFSAKFGGFNGTAGTVTLKVGNTTVGTGSLNASNDVTVTATNTTTVGTVLTVTVTGISKGVKAYEINVTYNN